MQAVAVIKQRVQGLQRRADIVELDFLRVQAAPRGLDVVLEHLAARAGAVNTVHRPRPDTPGHAADYRVFRIHAVTEKETQVRREIIDLHAPTQVILDQRKTVGQRKRELADRIRARLGNVITGNRHAIEIAYAVVDKIGLHVAHHAHRKLGRKNTGILRLVLLEDIGLNRTPRFSQRLGLELFISAGIDQLIATDPQQAETEAIVPAWQLTGVYRSLPVRVKPVYFFLRLLEQTVLTQISFDVLIDRGIHEHRQQHRRRTVDRHRDRSCGRQQVNAGIQLFHIVQRSDGNA